MSKTPDQAQHNEALEELQAVIELKDKEIQSLESSGQNDSSQIGQLTKDKRELQKLISAMKANLKSLRKVFIT